MVVVVLWDVQHKHGRGGSMGLPAQAKFSMRD